MTRTPNRTTHYLHRVPTEYGDVVLNAKTGDYWHLNASASQIVEVLECGGSLDEAALDLVKTYGIDEATARRDVTAVSAALQKLGAL